ncbi:RHS repeat domain-containing protein, partial [Winogradskyella luteola]
AELIKYSQTQVSPYTGLPSIQIPFHTISHGGVSVPIGIAYSGGGIKVADIASWVGLGWNLQAGGLVSRTINWLPDDNDNLGYMYTSFDMAHFKANPDSSGFCCDPNEQSYQLLDHVAMSRDYEPDEFNYSIPGYSGTFYFDQALDDFVQLPYTNVKIEKVVQSPSNRKIIGFKITVPNGTVYHFGGTEPYMERIREVRSMSLTNSGVYSGTNSMYTTSIDPYYQSWMLRRIELPVSSTVIEFEYELEDNVKAIFKSNEEFLPGWNSQHEMKYSINYSQKIYTQPKLKTITFPTGSVEFKRGSVERGDLANSYPLESITLFDSAGNFIKKMQLETSQSDAIPDNEYPFFSQDPAFYKRLRLDGISIQNAANEKSKEYTFEYNPQKLPHRFSRAVDYFGYFNGRDNIDLIPRANYLPPIPLAYWGNADRSVEPDHTQAEVLTGITYPTGGYEEFIWENNTISYFKEGSVHQYRDHLLEHTEIFDSYSCMHVDGDPSNGYDHSMTIDVPVDSDGILDFDITVEGCPYTNGIQVLNDQNCSYTLYLTDLTDAPNAPQTLLAPKFKQFLTPGNSYRISATYNGNFQGCNNLQTGSPSPGDFRAIIKYTEDPTPGEYMYAGLRIKELKTFNDPSATEPQLWKKYDYTYHEESATPDLTSGGAYRLPINYIGNYSRLGLAAGDVGEYQIFSSAPLVPINGTMQGYLNVTESHYGQLDTNGSKRYTFSEFDFGQNEQVGNNAAYYYSPFPEVHKKVMLSNWRNGNLVETGYYDREGNLVKSEHFDYETANTFQKDPWDFAVEVFRMPDTEGQGNNGYAYLYGYTTEHHRLKSQTTTDYLDGGDVTVTQVHTYDNNPLLASSTSTTSSNGNVQESHITYAQDLASPTPAEQILIDQNRFEPVRTEQTVSDANDVLAQSATQTVYQIFGATRALPSAVQTLKGGESPTNLPKNRIHFYRYEANGKPMEVSRADGTRIIYIWGYNNTLPVAKIENASYETLTPGQQTAIGEAKFASAWEGDTCMGTTGCEEADLRDSLNALRAEFPDAMVTTYTYDPLVGATSMTDPKGRTVYYEYDNFNRLKQVRDEDGNIMGENRYNYHTSSNN